MTVTTNGHTVSGTVRDGVQVCVRAPENAPEAPDPAVERSGSMYTRAISRKAADLQATSTAKVRNFVSPHVEGVKDAVVASRTVQDRPMTVGQAWAQVLPEQGGFAAKVGGTAAGLFRALVLSLAFAVSQAVSGRIGAGVALALFVLAAAAGCTASTLT